MVLRAVLFVLIAGFTGSLFGQTLGGRFIGPTGSMRLIWRHRDLRLAHRFFQLPDLLQHLHLRRDDVGIFQQGSPGAFGGRLGKVFPEIQRLAVSGQILELAVGDRFFDAVFGEFRPVHEFDSFGSGKTHLW